MLCERGHTHLIVFMHACGYYSRAATIRGAASIRINTVSGPYAAFLKGGLHGGVAQIGMMWELAHSPPRGVWGHAPPENFGNLDSSRAILRHSDSDLQFQIL